MSGHSMSGKAFGYALLTVKDNIVLFTPEILDKINRIVVKHGHIIVGKAPGAELNGSCDSFPVETNVHFRTDSNLLLDSLRKIIFLIMTLCAQQGITAWRKGMFNFTRQS
jgi:hypothetical protein